MTSDERAAHVREAERALGALVGLPLRGSAREENALYLDFGAHTLQVLCAWRLTSGAEVVAGSGDLFTPADPDAEVEEFDWLEAGSTWWDLRMRAFHTERDAAPPVVRAARVDPWLGVQVDFEGGARLEVFPHSAASPHVVTEHWRLVPDDAAAPGWTAHTEGVETSAAGPPGA